VESGYLERILDAELLPPTPATLPRSKRQVDIVTLLRSEVRAGVKAARCDDCFAPNKPVLKFGRRRTWAEFVVLGLLERDGWSGPWVKNWPRAGRPRVQFCSGIGRATKITDPAAATMFAALDEEAGHPQGGVWDIFAWRGNDYLIIESKQQGSSDHLKPNQLAWLEACIRVGLPLDSFALVRYDAGPSLGDLPAVDLSAPSSLK
jgi:VRR-NUC domain